jgi:hypothetical protein
MRFRPFRADNIFGVPFPGRCPGLSHPAPLARRRMHINSLTKRGSITTNAIFIKKYGVSTRVFRRRRIGLMGFSWVFDITKCLGLRWARGFRPFRADNIFGSHSQGVALGYLIQPRWGLNLITLSHILLELLFLQAMLAFIRA